MMNPAHGRTRIGLLGGSFNPVHVGHLAIGRAAADALSLDRLIAIPTGNSWQKSGTKHAQVQASHRLAMMQIAVASMSTERSAGCQWTVDDVEVGRTGPSYTVDTLQALRRRFGASPALILILGSDQLRNLDTWHRWQELPDYAHIAATQRERVPLTGLPAAVERVVTARGRQALPDTPCGSIVFFQMPPVAVSATALREQLSRGECPEELLPPGVADYIRQHRLYQD
jgi:nicotinate-nucleotide adenylyltransferase